MGDAALSLPVEEQEVTDITVGELVSEQFGARTLSTSTGQRRLMLENAQIATIGSDTSHITPLVGVSSEEESVVDILAALAAHHPTGVMVLESPDRMDAYAFQLICGRLTGARGVGQLEDLEPFMAKVMERYPHRFGDPENEEESAKNWYRLARQFLQERALEQLTAAREPGARMTFLRGDIQWACDSVPEDRGPSLDFLLLEHARRWDEMPKIMTRLGSLHRIALPVSEPALDASASRDDGPPMRDWDFFADPDPAAQEEWSDAMSLWRLCDGETTIDDIVEGAMLGRFRGLAGLRTLVQFGHVIVGEKKAALPPPPLHGESGAISLDDFPVHGSMAPVIPLPSVDEGDPHAGLEPGVPVSLPEPTLEFASSMIEVPLDSESDDIDDELQLEEDEASDSPEPQSPISVQPPQTPHLTREALAEASQEIHTEAAAEVATPVSLAEEQAPQTPGRLKLPEPQPTLAPIATQLVSDGVPNYYSEPSIYGEPPPSAKPPAAKELTTEYSVVLRSPRRRPKPTRRPTPKPARANATTPRPTNQPSAGPSSMRPQSVSHHPGPHSAAPTSPQLSAQASVSNAPPSQPHSVASAVVATAPKPDPRRHLPAMALAGVVIVVVGAVAFAIS